MIRSFPARMHWAGTESTPSAISMPLCPVVPQSVMTKPRKPQSFRRTPLSRSAWLALWVPLMQL